MVEQFEFCVLFMQASGALLQRDGGALCGLQARGWRVDLRGEWWIVGFVVTSYVI
jgi:hypothetical protein